MDDIMSHRDKRKNALRLYAEHLHLEVVNQLGESEIVADIHVHRPDPLRLRHTQSIGTVCDKTRIQFWRLSKPKDHTDKPNAVAVSWVKAPVKDDKATEEEIKAKLAALGRDGDINSLMKKEVHVHIHLSARGYSASFAALEFKEDENGNFEFVEIGYGDPLFEGFSATLSRGKGNSTCNANFLTELPFRCNVARFLPHLRESQKAGELATFHQGPPGLTSFGYNCVPYEVTNVAVYDGDEGRQKLDKSGWSAPGPTDCSDM